MTRKPKNLADALLGVGYEVLGSYLVTMEWNGGKKIQNL